MSAQADLAYYLEAQSLGEPGVTLFYDAEADVIDPQAVVSTLYGYGGEPGEYEHTQTLPAIDTQRVQVKVRSRDYEGAWGLAETEYNTLHLVNVQLSANFYTMIRPMQRPFIMGRDENGRFAIGFNLRARRRN